MIGEVLGNYRVIAKLGAGGMGTVWTAEHQLLGSHAAIKVLLPDLSKQDTIVQRFFDEARAATRIRDPGIVTVLDFGWHHGEAYIVMEMLVGETLARRLGTGRIPPVQAVRWIQMCGLAMAAAHARGIIHRDIKPDNIFLVADPAVPGGERIKVLDFGIAKLLDREPATGHPATATGVIMGTPAYMSPEQCRGAGAIDHRTDIYALGCVLFELLCGRPPFVASTPGDMIASQLRQDPPRPGELVPDLAPEIDALVLRCLAKDPDQRYATMTELVRAGAAITGDNHVLDTIPPMVAPPRDAGSATVASLPPAAGRAPSTPSRDGQWPARPVATTQDTGPGSLDHVEPSRRGNARSTVLVLGLAVALAAVVVVLVTRSGDGPAGAPVGAASARDASAGDGGTRDASTRDAALVVPGPRADGAIVERRIHDAGVRDGARVTIDAGAPRAIVPHPRPIDAGTDPSEYYQHR